MLLGNLFMNRPVSWRRVCWNSIWISEANLIFVVNKYCVHTPARSHAPALSNVSYCFIHDKINRGPPEWKFLWCDCQSSLQWWLCVKSEENMANKVLQIFQINLDVRLMATETPHIFLTCRHDIIQVCPIICHEN